MASGILEVPAQHIPKVVEVVRTGLDHLITEHQMAYDEEVYIRLTKWCEDMETFMAGYNSKKVSD